MLPVAVSSPPARGSSQPPGATDGGAVVVPARAGIFPGLPRAPQGWVSRPRPRGDLPIAGHGRIVHVRSSPPARGSSVRVKPRHFLRRVVPARAGIFPPARTSQRFAVGRPRPRGDLPGRGFSGLLRSYVVPACAGIFLASSGRHSGPGRRPRPRGDLPGRVADRLADVRSSPPARGSSPPCTGRPGCPAVVPARAGIFPRAGCPGPGIPGRPRPRGDLPRDSRQAGSHAPSSPPARGSSRVSRPARAPPPVVPARAGIFPARSGAYAWAPSRPRPRGDLPYVTRCSHLVRQSSPPARGSSGCPQHLVALGEVVPARAGIFRVERVRDGRVSGRPRPRGDLPQSLYVR